MISKSTSTPAARIARTCSGRNAPYQGTDAVGYMFVTTSTRMIPYHSWCWGGEPAPALHSSADADVAQTERYTSMTCLATASQEYFVAASRRARWPMASALPASENI